MTVIFKLKTCARLICVIVAITSLLTYFRSKNTNTKYVLHVSTGNEMISFVYPEKKNTTYITNSHINYNYPKLQDFVQMFQSRYTSKNSIFAVKSNESYNVFLKRLSLFTKKGQMLVKETEILKNTTASRFFRGINQQRLYDPNDEELLQDLLQDMATLPIASAVESDVKGTQFKVTLTFVDGTRARVKLMRIPKEVESTVDMHPGQEFERHFAEIAGYHVDKILGFNRVIPTVGRLFNITTDLKTLLSNETLVEHVYRSPAGNLCFAVYCKQLCGRDYPFCGRPDVIEGAVTVELISGEKYKRYDLKNEYTRIYKKRPWMADQNTCMDFVTNHTSRHRSRMPLDQLDLSLYDFLIGNGDRHSYQMFNDLGTESFPFIYDNGRSFRYSYFDEPIGLVPIQQCCEIRLSTLAKLVKLYSGPDSLSQLMRSSMISDPVSPVLLEPQLQALDRRLGKIIKAVSDCVSSGKPWDDIVIDDGII
uniref:FAM20 C-terminal domain-containing protein n=1 Tax=Arion vulgaris TaxID=1028688 RepID=A0A0B7BDM0_9EUPU